ncbi:MAG: hypothetical protein KG003_07605 [Bacteroidetes bacterium]|nr:hypothetical protein [Bacteroidota bacterium]
MKANTHINNLVNFGHPVQVLIDFSRMNKTELKSFLKDLEVDMTGIKGDKSLALARITFRDFVAQSGKSIDGWDFSADLAILNDEFESYSARFDYMASRKYR